MLRAILSMMSTLAVTVGIGVVLFVTLHHVLTRPYLTQAQLLREYWDLYLVAVAAFLAGILGFHWLRASKK